MRTTRLGRRARFGAATVVILVATGVSCVMANLIAHKVPMRMDVTSVGEHRLSERTRTLLDSLTGDYEVIIAADWRMKDRRVATRVQDALDRFDSASEHVSTTIIDTGTPSGLASYDALLSRLVEREADQIRAQQALLSQALAQVEASGTLYTSMAEVMIGMADALTGADPIIQQSRTYFLNQANQLRSAAAEETAAAVEGREALSTPGGALDVPALHQTRLLLERRLAKIDTDQSVLAQNLGVFASDRMPEEVARAAGQLRDQVRARRDQVAIMLDRVARLEMLDVTRVAGVLTAGEAAVVIGPDGLVGIDMTMLLPPGAWLDRERGVEADMGRRAEELLASAVGTLASPDRPIVIVVHGQPGPFIDQIPVIEIVRRRLEIQGIDMVEWPVVAEPDHPDLSEIDPTGRRTPVYVMIGTNTNPTTQEDGPSGPERAEMLGRVLEQLVADGQRIMFSLVPSYLPGIGVDDPMLMALAPFGLSADTGRPLLREVATEDGRRIESLFRLKARTDQNPLLEAIGELPTALDWPVGLTINPAEGATHHVLFKIDGDDTWGESQWANFQQTPPDQRAAMPNPPAPNAGRDWVDGPFVVGVAAERRIEGTNLTQRAMVMGSYNWFFDQLTNEATLIDERIVATNPGNAELFEAGVLWLAGRDDLIARSPTARATPRIGAIAPNRLNAIRWILVAGLPGLVLLLGGLWRLVAR